VDNYRTEEEQVEALKRWWQENGRSMITSVVVAIGLGLGWNYWQANREAALENASFSYQQMLQRLSQGTPADIATARQEAEMLLAEHSDTPYAQFAALHLARLLVTEGNAEEAEEKLRWVVAEADGETQAIAQMRLARVLAERGATEEALDMLVAGQGGELAASFAIARGDVLLAAGRDDEARLAYDAALAVLDPSQPVPESLQEKISYLNPQPAAAADPEAG
jgi:predicted negative regulator of RcsB-dependent stress response